MTFCIKVMGGKIDCFFSFFLFFVLKNDIDVI